jgi:hypothetical protein
MGRFESVGDASNFSSVDPIVIHCAILGLSQAIQQITENDAISLF